MATLSAETPPIAKPAPRAPCETVTTPPLRLTEPAMATLPRPVLVRLAATAEPTEPLRFRLAKRLATWKVPPAGPMVRFCAAVVLTGLAWVPVAV